MTCGTPVLVVLDAHQRYVCMRDLIRKHYDMRMLVYPDRNGSVKEETARDCIQKVAQAYEIATDFDHKDWENAES